ncbi:hypothetical protein BpHYR1_012431 [Brachionus plicatilis]|uniref:Uncharacterized protein n=1 Tax=Brachionus plicatilis TaxID=10195 RepID=A0A3M7SNR5_BRAPC|nr:hypothetical protein BpHYR1_012431 [Brachionus plicatilis]
MINIVESDGDFYSDDEEAVAPCIRSKQIALELGEKLNKQLGKTKRRRHIVAVAMKTELTEIDFSFRDIGMKKKRERKAQAKEWFVKNTN